MECIIDCSNGFYSGRLYLATYLRLASVGSDLIQFSLLDQLIGLCFQLQTVSNNLAVKQITNAQIHIEKVIES